MVKKSKGFNWGPAATGLSRWTGVRLSVLLNHCGIKSPEQVPSTPYITARGSKNMATVLEPNTAGQCREA